MTDNLSLADIAAVTDKNDGMWGGNSAWIIIFLIFALGGGGLWGNRSMPVQTDAVTEAGLCNAMNFNDLSNAVGRASDMSQTRFMQTYQGLASVGYENLRNFAETQKLVQNGDYALSNQMADCCCKTQTAIKDVEYQGAMNTAAINANVTAQTQRVLDAIAENKMAEMQARINQLETANVINAATAGVVKYPMATTYTSGANPFCAGGGCCGQAY